MLRLLTDLAGPFYDPAKPFRNWSALPFYQLDLPTAPFVDMGRLERGLARATEHLAAVAAQGYTGVVIDNLAHLVTFDDAPEPVYAPDEPCRLRALAYGAAFSRLFAAAAALGLEVFVTTDMQWATPGLRRYVGRLTPGNPRVAAANRWAVAELFARLPQVRGLFVRIGEAGGAHDQGGYTGHMIYRTPAQVRRLIGELLPVCAQHDRLLVLRTWSVGIGRVGDLLCSPARYAEVVGGLSSPHLLVSIKHGPADFFRHLPANPTLGLPGPRQIVELQNRREYELFGMAPSGIAALHRQALAGAANGGRLDGVWAWNATGGWGGGSAALGTTGWSLWTELSSALTAALVRTPGLDAAAFVRGWCATRLGQASGAAFAAAAAELYLESEELVERGWYLGPLAPIGAQRRGLVPPPLLWVWWTRPTAAAPFWAYLAASVPDVQRCLGASRHAYRRLCAHAARLAALAPGATDDAVFVVTSAAYLRDCVAVALALREVLLPAFKAANAGDRDGWASAATRAAGSLAALAQHRATWEGRADFPALELAEVEAYLRRLEAAPASLWRPARIAGMLASRFRRGELPPLWAVGAGAAGVALLGAWGSGRARTILLGLLAAGALAAPLRRPAVHHALPWLSRRYHLLPSAFFEAGPAIGEWAG